MISVSSLVASSLAMSTASRNKCNKSDKLDGEKVQSSMPQSVEKFVSFCEFIGFGIGALFIVFFLFQSFING